MKIRLKIRNSNCNVFSSLLILQVTSSSNINNSSFAFFEKRVFKYNIAAKINLKKTFAVK